MLTIRRAQALDSETLTDIAVQSEASWGYDSRFMATFREIYGVTPEFIARNPVFVAEETGALLGFYALVANEEGLALEYLYLKPSDMGKGLGKILWSHMVDYCRQIGITEFHLVCGPQPKAFYLKMGAVELGEVVSLVTPGRKVTKLVYHFA